MKAYDPLLEKIKKEVKMTQENKNPEQEMNLQEQFPELAAFFGSLMKPYGEAIEHLQSDFDGFQNGLVELLYRPLDELRIGDKVRAKKSYPTITIDDKEITIPKGTKGKLSYVGIMGELHIDWQGLPETHDMYSADLLDFITIRKSKPSMSEAELKHQSAEEFVLAFEANKIEDSELAQRIFSAIRGAGYDIVLKEPIVAAEALEASETKEAELEEPDVVAGKKKGYRYLPAFNISIKN